MAKKKQEPTMEERYNQKAEAINEMVNELQDELEKGKRFKAAARRARKLTSELTQEFKEFRRISNDYDKVR